MRGARSRCGARFDQRRSSNQAYRLDSGQGLGSGDPERPFELIYRSDAARAVPGGAGIGLLVCRQLIEAMGGRMWANPPDGGGAEFGFTLPIVDNDL